MKQATCSCVMAMALTLSSAAVAGPTEDGNAGLDALKAGNYTKAVQMFTRAIASPQMAPEDKEFAYVQRGIAYLNLNNKAAAKLDFERALKIKPDDSDAREGLDRVGSEVHAGSGHAGARSRLANPQKVAQDGMDALNGGDYPRAIDSFSRVIASGQLSGYDLELAYVSRGKAYLKHGDYRLSAQDLNTALEDKNDDEDALQALGEALGHMPPPSGQAPVDEGLCKKNFTTSGNLISGKGYTTFVDYPGLDRLDGFAGLYRTIGKHSPAMGNWQIVQASMREGTIKATITFGDTGRAITQDDHLEQTGRGLRITMTEQVPGLLPTIDLKGSMCKTLAMLIK